MSLKVGHHSPASETPLKWRFTGVAIMAPIEYWLGSFVIFRGSGSILLGNPIFLCFFQGGGPPVPPLWKRPWYLGCISYLHMPLPSRLMTVLNYRSWREKTWVRGWG